MQPNGGCKSTALGTIAIVSLVNPSNDRNVTTFGAHPAWQPFPTVADPTSLIVPPRPEPLVSDGEWFPLQEAMTIGRGDDVTAGDTTGKAEADVAQASLGC